VNPQPGLQRILIVGLNQNVIADGVLATLSVAGKPCVDIGGWSADKKVGIRRRQRSG
jgi:hypothetical protein